MGRKLIIVGEPSIGMTIETIFKENNVPVTVVVQESPEKRMMGELIERSKKEAEAISKLISIEPLSYTPSSRNLRRKKERDLRKKSHGNNLQVNKKRD